MFQFTSSKFSLFNKVQFTKRYQLRLALSPLPNPLVASLFTFTVPPLSCENPKESLFTGKYQVSEYFRCILYMWVQHL